MSLLVLAQQRIMKPTIDYASAPSRRWHDWPGIVAMFVGLVLLAIGVALAVFTWQGLQRTDSPNYDWGPNQYVIGIHRLFAWLTVIVLGMAVTFVLVGIRRLKRARAAVR